MKDKRIQKALISVYHKEGLQEIAQLLHQHKVQIYSTGGTASFLEQLNIPVHAIETLTDYPSILGGRVKTLHPKVFGGILARDTKEDRNTLETYKIPSIDLVIVDLYPFEETLAAGGSETEIIEKIDIGGISLIRAAAKNYREVAVIPSREQYAILANQLEQSPYTSLEFRKKMAAAAFATSAHYDNAILSYFAPEETSFSLSIQEKMPLRYGENPHQKGVFWGSLDKQFDQIQGKTLSYNNLLDIHNAISLMSEFVDAPPSFAILKHTNPCGLAIGKSPLEAWEKALAGDPVSAFGGILICNRTIDEALAEKINNHFYEVLIAPGLSEKAREILAKKKKRIILLWKQNPLPSTSVRSILGGVLEQEIDQGISNYLAKTSRKPSQDELTDVKFAELAVKHLKSNAIALVKGQQLIGAGMGQPSRIDALQQAIGKAIKMGFDPKGSVLASDAFFPFSDAAQAAWEAGIEVILQPGGSIKDEETINFCESHQMCLIFTGVRHFKH